jgi:hypothetical protein
MAELFDKFELDRRSRWPMMMRLLGGSIVLHIIMLACAFYVPAVRDALNIASTFSGDSFVDKEYRKTQLQDRAQILNLPKFQYPEGYFYKEPLVDPNAPVIVTTAAPVVTPPVVITPPLMSKGPRGVRQPKVPVPTASPSPSVDPAQATAATTEQPQTPAEADKAIDKVAAANNVGRPDENEINKRPLKDWLKNANDLKAQGKLDLNKPVEIVIMAEFDEDGKLKGTPFITQKSGDPALIKLASDLVVAVIDSNMMHFLKDPQTKRLEARQMRITVKLNDQEVVGKVESDAASPERAQQLSTAYNTMLFFGQKARQGKDEEVLMKGTKVTAEGKQIIINFNMTRQAATEMLKKQLASSET